MDKKEIDIEKVLYRELIPIKEKKITTYGDLVLEYENYKITNDTQLGNNFFKRYSEKTINRAISLLRELKFYGVKFERNRCIVTDYLRMIEIRTKKKINFRDIDIQRKIEELRKLQAELDKEIEYE